MKNGAKMEAQGTPHGDQNGGISWTFRNPLPEALPGRVLDGFGEDFERVLEEFGRPGGVQMDTKMKEFRGHFVTTSQEPPGFPRPLQP